LVVAPPASPQARFLYSTARAVDEVALSKVADALHVDAALGVLLDLLDRLLEVTQRAHAADARLVLELARRHLAAEQNAFASMFASPCLTMRTCAPCFTTPLTTRQPAIVVARDELASITNSF
jgi:hypothetical protein